MCSDNQSNFMTCGSPKSTPATHTAYPSPEDRCSGSGSRHAMEGFALFPGLDRCNRRSHQPVWSDHSEAPRTSRGGSSCQRKGARRSHKGIGDISGQKRTGDMGESRRVSRRSRSWMPPPSASSRLAACVQGGIRLGAWLDRGGVMLVGQEARCPAPAPPRLSRCNGWRSSLSCHCAWRRHSLVAVGGVKVGLVYPTFAP
jgi:hypothetical protein